MVLSKHLPYFYVSPLNEFCIQIELFFLLNFLEINKLIQINRIIQNKFIYFFNFLSTLFVKSKFPISTHSVHTHKNGTLTSRYEKKKFIELSNNLSCLKPISNVRLRIVSFIFLYTRFGRIRFCFIT